MGVDFGLLDADDQLLAAPRHYRDERRAAAAETVFSRVSARELYQRTGIQLLPINTIFELSAMAAEHDAALERARDAAPDSRSLSLLALRQQDVRVHERHHDAVLSTRPPGPGRPTCCDRLDIPASLFPEIVTPGTRLGSLAPEAVEATGLDRAEVVAVATHDTGSAVAAVPMLEAGSVYLSIGTWSLVGLEVARPVIDDDSFAANVTNEGGVGGTFRLLRNVGGLWLLDECRRCWADEGSELTFDELVSLAADAPSFLALVDPSAELFLEPGDMPARIKEFCRESGQREPGTPGEIVRCVLESLALKHAETIGVLHDVTGVVPRSLHVVGGGARNALLCSWTASAAELPVLAGPEEATARREPARAGNGARGDRLSRARPARSRASRSSPSSYEPEPSAAWRESRERFAELSAGASLEVGA